MSESIISIRNLCKSFKETNVLRGINVNFEKGKIHGIIGRNGSGKTLMIKCITGFMPVTSGEIEVEGKIVGKDVDIPRNIGIIIETPGFLPNYSGYKNLLFLANIRHRIDKQQIRDAISFVGLDPKSKKHVGKYSLGMRQRLAIAQAIMEDPDIYILDEPMNGLDKHGLKDMRILFLNLRERGKTILLASHSAEDIDILCDSVYEIDEGLLTQIR
jgi:ABC-2 type transport system ATP-binding protein